MKKVFSVLVSLFLLTGIITTSCQVDSDSSSPAPEFDPVICDGGANPKTEWTVKSGKTLNIYLTSKNYLKDLEFTGVDALTSSGEVIDTMKFLVSENSVETRSVYKISIDGLPSECGTYNCSLYVAKKSDKNTKKTLPFTVKVEANGETQENPTPVIKTQPVGATYNKGDTLAALTVEATISSGTISYQWYKDENLIEGAISTSYTPTEKGKYYVKVSNAADSTKFVNSSVVSIIVLAEGELVPPTITKDLDEKVSYDKTSDIKALNIEATASETDATIYGKWYKGTVAVSTESDVLTYSPKEFGTYYCEVWVEKDGKVSQSVTSKSITISENPIVTTITGLSPTAYTNETLSVSYTTNVDTKKVTYQWYTTDATSGTDTAISDATSESYTPTKAGKYKCKVTVVSVGGQTKTSDNGGTCTVSKKQTGDPVTPSITTDLTSSVSVKAGGTLTLSVNAKVSDGGTLSYVWKKGGQSIDGATSATYTKANVTVSDAGSYTVDVINTLNGKTAIKTSSACEVTVYSRRSDWKC